VCVYIYIYIYIYIYVIIYKVCGHDMLQTACSCLTRSTSLWQRGTWMDIGQVRVWGQKVWSQGHGETRYG